MADALAVAGTVFLILPEKLLNKVPERLLPFIEFKYLYGRIEVSKEFHPLQDRENVVGPINSVI